MEQGLLTQRNKGAFTSWQVPFTVLQGEGVEFLGRAADALIAISNYRLHIKFKDSVINVSSCFSLPHRSWKSCEMEWFPCPPCSCTHLLLFPSVPCFHASFSQLQVCGSLLAILPFIPLLDCCAF